MEEEATSMSENQVVSHVAHHLVEKSGILLLEELEEGNNHGSNKIWICREKQTETRP
jgi:hypothetical protein